MPRAARSWFDCIDCGAHVHRRLRPDRSKVCLECGIRRATEAAEQLHNKSGPAYDRWERTNGPLGRLPTTDKPE